MPSLSVLIQRGEVCQCLRVKTMFYDELDAPGQAERSADAEGPFWCAQTQSLLGPDGQVADAVGCRPGRSCCETT